MSEEFSTGLTEYEVNKQAIKQNYKPMSTWALKQEIQEIAVKIKSWVWEYDNHYFMLLCKQLSNYTLFNITADNFDMKELKEALMDCFVNRGSVYKIAFDKTYGGFQIWIDDGEDLNMYFLFPYDLGVIEIGEE